jgi:hypothetical protein
MIDDVEDVAEPAAVIACRRVLAASDWDAHSAGDDAIALADADGVLQAVLPADTPPATVLLIVLLADRMRLVGRLSEILSQ